MNKTLRNALIATAAIAACTFGTKAEASVKNYGDVTGECNEHGWLMKTDAGMLSIGRSHDFIFDVDGETYTGGWTHMNRKTIRLHHAEGSIDVSPRCHGGGLRF